MHWLGTLAALRSKPAWRRNVLSIPGALDCDSKTREIGGTGIDNDC